MRANTYNDSLWQPFGLAIGVHLLLAALVVLGSLNWKPFKQHKPMALTIEAVIVDTTQMATRRDEALKAAEAAQKKQELEKNRADELEKQKQREREQTLEKQQQAELEKQKQLELDKQKQVDAEKQLQVEKQKQAEAENLRIKQQEDEARKKKEAQDKLAALRKEQEKKREEERVQQQKELEQVRQQQEEAEKKRKLEEERLKQLEAREKASEQAAEKARADEMAIKAQQDREAKTALEGKRAELGDQYTLLLQQIVTENWLRPPTARPGLRCILKIVQIPGGEVISAAISGACNGDEATRRSIVAAVERIEALPYRGFEEVFAREIDFEFKYDGE